MLHCPVMKLVIELEREDDGGGSQKLPTSQVSWCMGFEGRSHCACASARSEVLADRIEHGESEPALLDVSSMRRDGLGSIKARRLLACLERIDGRSSDRPARTEPLRAGLGELVFAFHDDERSTQDALAIAKKTGLTPEDL